LDVQHEMDALLKNLRLPKDVSAECAWTFVGESFDMDKTEPILSALTAAYRDVMGRRMAFGRLATVVDANRLVPLANVPTALIGFDTQYAHADHEFIRVRKLENPCRFALLTILNYLEAKADRPLASKRSA